ncbi:MAG: hypothetical protein IPK08_06075 [Bacteroidetes bacterium]|nr:hypothetical protein [Bacteroidota bacterium]
METFRYAKAFRLSSIEANERAQNLLWLGVFLAIIALFINKFKISFEFGSFFIDWIALLLSAILQVVAQIQTAKSKRYHMLSRNGLRKFLLQTSLNDTQHVDDPVTQG